MNESLIRNHNERVKPTDILYHVGDFCFKGGKEGSKTKVQVWEEKLNGKIIHINGNHDSKNSGKELIEAAIMKMGGFNVLVQHVPPTMALEVPEFVDFVICGHVHDAWKHKILEDHRNERIPIFIINVGTDQWNFRPVRLDELLAYYQQNVKNSLL